MPERQSFAERVRMALQQSKRLPPFGLDLVQLIERLAQDAVFLTRKYDARFELRVFLSFSLCNFVFWHISGKILRGISSIPAARL